MDAFMQAAIDEARQGLSEGGIPIGSVLVHEERLLVEGITAAFNRAVLCCTAKWMLWKMLAGYLLQPIETVPSIPRYPRAPCVREPFCSMEFLE